MKKDIWGSKEIKVKKLIVDDEPRETPNVVEVSDNHIYFYADIDAENVLRLNKALRDKAGDLLTEQVKRRLKDPIPIYLYIYSYGGTVFAGLSAMDEIINCPVPVYTIVDGACASAATFLSVVGTKRYIKQNAVMLIHQLSSMSWGKYRELKDDMKNMDLLMDKIKAIYKQYTKVPEEELDGILEHDLWWDAEKCVSYKLVDEII